MELEPEHRPLASLFPQSPSRARSGAWWIAIIAVGVLTGNALSFAAQTLYERWQVNDLMQAFEQMLQTPQGASLEWQRAQEHNDSVRARLWQTCLFWREQVRTENTTKNRHYRDMACAKVR